MAKRTRLKNIFSVGGETFADGALFGTCHEMRSLRRKVPSSRRKLKLTRLYTFSFRSTDFGLVLGLYGVLDLSCLFKILVLLFLVGSFDLSFSKF